MCDTPIIFSAPMILAIDDNRKTKTRRIPTRLRGKGPVSELGPSDTPGYDWHFRDQGARWHDVSTDRLLELLPWRAGDRLWVREAHAISANPDYPAWYRAGHEEARAAGPRVDVKWRPSIHMPRWASRFTLIVESVKVERLQDISEADALAEGCFKGKATGRIYRCMASMRLGGGEWACARDWYADLWERLHGADAWNANPFVAAITFRTIRANIDTLDANGRPLVCEGVTL